MKALRVLTVCALLLVVASTALAANAAGLGRGANLFTVQLTGGDADLYAAITDVNGDVIRLQGFQHTEVGAQAQLWHFPTEHFAFNVTGGLGFWQEKDEYGPGAPTTPDLEQKIQSWNVRIGGDRVTHLADNSIHIFMGPGIQLWQGKTKLEQGGVESETENVTRWALSGRMVGHLAINDRFGLVGQIGHFIGRASTDDRGAHSSWWTSGNDGALGLGVRF